MKKILAGIKEDLTVKNKDFIITAAQCVGIAVSTLLSIYFGFFVWVTLALCIICAFTSRGGRAAYVLAFFLPLAFVTNIEYSFHPLALIILVCAIAGRLLISVIIRFIRKKEKVKILPIIGAVVLIISFAISSVLGHRPEILGCIVFLYCLYILRADIDLKEVMFLLFAGIATSMFLGLFVTPDTRVFSLLFTNWRVGHRYGGLNIDPNIFATDVIICIIFLLTLRMNNKMKFLFYPMLAFLVVCTILSGSKAGFIAIAMVFFIYFVSQLVRNIKEKRIREFVLQGVCILAVIGIATLCLYPWLSNMLVRFNIDESGILDSITTGRWSRIVPYMEAIFSNVWHALFGFGYGVPLIDGISSHNTFVTILFRAGIVGALCMVLWSVFLLVPIIRGKRINLYNIFFFIPIIFLIGAYNHFFTAFTVYLFLVLPILTFKASAPSSHCEERSDEAIGEAQGSERSEGSYPDPTPHPTKIPLLEKGVAPAG